MELDIRSVDARAEVRAPALIKKYKTREALESAYQDYRGKIAKLSDRNKCHNQDNCAVELTAFQIARELMEPA